jgi:CRISPR-associated protein Csb2
MDGINLCRLAELLENLAGKPPSIWLPRTSYGHLRHFFPFPVFEKDKGLKTSGSPVFDSFGAVSPEQPIYFEWADIHLSEAQKSDLNLLLSHLGYFGRAESWCDATLLDGIPDTVKVNETHWKCVCIEESDAETRKALGREHHDYEVKRRLAWDGNDFTKQAHHLLGFTELSDKARKALENEETKRNNKKTEKDGTKPAKTTSHIAAETEVAQWNSILAEPAAITLLRCLLRESGDDRSQASGLSRPIGTRWVHYAVPRAIFQVPPAPRSKPTLGDDFKHNPATIPEVERVQVVRFALNTNTVHRAVLPNVTATVAVAQRIRTVALGIFGRQNGGKLSPRLAGKSHTQENDLWQLFDQNDASVQSLKDHHAHASWWLTDEDRDGFLDHLNVVCADGFSRADVAALQSLVQVRQREGFPDLLLTPIFIGRLDALNVPGFFNQQQKTKTFVSATPYFCPVHLTRKSGKSRSVASVIQKSLESLGYGKDATIQEIVFDYDPATLDDTPNPRLTAVTLPKDFIRDASGKLSVTYYPPELTTFAANMPTAPAGDLGPLYPGALIRNPDDPCPLGQRSGFYVADGTRFVPSQKFASTRRDDQTKGPGRLFCITFTAKQCARPFALGKFSHFGLGLFVPRTA